MRRSILFLLGISLLAAGCGDSSSNAKNKDVVAIVNKEPIFASELAQDLAHRTRQDPLVKITP